MKKTQSRKCLLIISSILFLLLIPMHFLHADNWGAQVTDIYTDPSIVYYGQSGYIKVDVRNTSAYEAPEWGEGVFDVRIIVREPNGEERTFKVDNSAFEYNQAKCFSTYYVFDQEGTYTVTGAVYDNNGLESGWNSYHLFDSEIQTFAITIEKKYTIMKVYSASTEVGQSVQLRAKLSADGVGVSGKNITWRIEGTSIGESTTNSSGYAYKYYTPQDAGTKSIRAEFYGDTNYYGSYDSDYLEVEAPFQNPQLVESSCSISPSSQNLGSRITFNFRVYNPNNDSTIVGLGAAIRKSGGVNWIDDSDSDTTVSVSGESYKNCSRYFDIPSNICPGSYDIAFGLHNGSFTEQYDFIEKINQLTVSVPAPDMNPISPNPSNDGCYTISWSGIPYADSYQVQEDDNPSFSSPVTFTASSTSYGALDNNNGTYYYRVRAKRCDIFSEWSSVKSVVVKKTPIPDLEYVSGIPTTAFVGESFTFSVKATNLGGESPGGYISTSFQNNPVITYSGDGVVFDVINPGEPIFLKDGTLKPGGANYKLLDAYDSSWTNEESHTITITVTPQSAGPMYIWVRTTMDDNSSSECINDYSISNGALAVDQQGWTTKRFTIDVSDKNSISGKVTSSRWPYLGVAGVSVEADSEHSAVTNEAGEYEIENVPEGTYTVTASHPDYWATGTSNSVSQQVVVNGDETVDFSDFSCKGTASVSISTDKSSVGPGETFNVTVTLSNTGTSLTNLMSYIDVSFDDEKLSNVGQPQGSGWESGYPKVIAPGATDVWKVNPDGTLVQMTEGTTDYLVTASRRGNFANSASYSFTFPVTVKSDATAGDIVFKYRGTIGDSRDPVSTGSGSLDQQGWNIKESLISVQDSPVNTDNYWVMFSHDLGNSSSSSNSIPESVVNKWVPYESPIGNLNYFFISAPTVTANSVFFNNSMDGKIYCVDAETGALKWSRTMVIFIRFVIFDNRTYDFFTKNI